MKEIFLCTGNPGKVKEILDLLPPNITVRTLRDDGWDQDLPETGATLEENAIQKARWGFARTGLPSVADDSGLEVEALNGGPGVLSARFAGDQRSDKYNMEKVLAQLGATVNRRARFRTVIALCDANGTRVFEGTVDGTIAERNRGTHGFGYDPIFLPTGSELTYAEMTLQQKQRSSHRGKAVARLIEHLQTIS